MNFFCHNTGNRSKRRLQAISHEQDTLEFYQAREEAKDLQTERSLFLIAQWQERFLLWGVRSCPQWHLGTRDFETCNFVG
ncbi:hypothetical protein [Thioflexithrix psekupsensis]|uniref:hypothetical protein n=1 Tax=Thioflexithrix psekupsensis TaxID=1570016 RepID=UPI001120A81F|nr:hypothetical protein [Thioflexithrix psekupsensis]